MKRDLSKLIQKKNINKLKCGDTVIVKYHNNKEPFIVLCATPHYIDFMSKRSLIKNIKWKRNLVEEVGIDDTEEELNDLDVYQKANILEEYIDKDIRKKIKYKNKRRIWIPAKEEIFDSRYQYPYFEKLNKKNRIHIIPYKYWKLRLIIYNFIQLFHKNKNVDSNSAPICFRISA